MTSSMNITPLLLSSIYKEAKPSLHTLYAPLLQQAMEKYNITTGAQQAMFLAQVGHESGQLRYVKELASGEAYEGRKDLGNTSPGDGVKYKGRGLIQITGKTNYVLAGVGMDLPLLEHPELLEQPENAAMSAAWWWNNKKLNRFADVGDIQGCTKIINGGYNGLSDRTLLYKRAIGALCQ